MEPPAAAPLIIGGLALLAAALAALGDLAECDDARGGVGAYLVASRAAARARFAALMASATWALASE